MPSASLCARARSSTRFRIAFFTLLLLLCHVPSSPFHLPPPSSIGRSPTSLSCSPAPLPTPKEQEALEKVWRLRRSAMRSSFSFSSTLTSVVPSSSLSSSLYLSTFLAVFAAVLLRFGGRAALVSSMGLVPLPSDPALLASSLLESGSLSSLPAPILAALTDAAATLSSFDPAALSLPSKVLLLLPFWLTAKVFLLDYLAVPLALSSGILFDSVLLGGLISSLLATAASLPPFLASRFFPPLRTRTLSLAASSPYLRGLSSLLSRAPVKTIATIRLAPLAPIPIGGYNYAYGALTNATAPQFLAGIFIGSLKPYMLDSYLGMAGLDLAGGGGGVSDAVLIGTLFAAGLVGALAAGFVSEAWEAVREEFEEEEGAASEGAASEGGFKLPLADLFAEAEGRILDVLQYEKARYVPNEDVWGWADPLGKEGEEGVGDLPEDAPEKGGLDLGLMTAETTVFWFVVLKEMFGVGQNKKS